MTIEFVAVENKGTPENNLFLKAIDDFIEQNPGFEVTREPESTVVRHPKFNREANITGTDRSDESVIRMYVARLMKDEAGDYYDKLVSTGA